MGGTAQLSPVALSLPPSLLQSSAMCCDIVTSKATTIKSRQHLTRFCLHSTIILSFSAGQASIQRATGPPSRGAACLRMARASVFPSPSGISSAALHAKKQNGKAKLAVSTRPTRASAKWRTMRPAWWHSLLHCAEPKCDFHHLFFFLRPPVAHSFRNFSPAALPPCELPWWKAAYPAAVSQPLQ